MRVFIKKSQFQSQAQKMINTEKNNFVEIISFKTENLILSHQKWIKKICKNRFLHDALHFILSFSYVI